MRAGVLVGASRRVSNVSSKSMTKWTETQLERGAKGVAYRSQQLLYTTVLQVPMGFPGLFAQPYQTVIRNSFIESALTSARVLAYFLRPKQRDEDAHWSQYQPEYSDLPDQDLTGRIVGVISEHLSHGTLGSRHGDPHPGHWPLGELSLTLVTGVHDLVSTLDESAKRWFGPPDIERTYEELLESHLEKARTQESENESVRQLTLALQRHLGWAGGRRPTFG